MMPDKIFVGTDPFGFMHAYYIENHPPYGEAYIRKDALLEWIDEYKNYSAGPSWDLLKTHIESL